MELADMQRSERCPLKGVRVQISPRPPIIAFAILKNYLADLLLALNVNKIYFASQNTCFIYYFNI